MPINVNTIMEKFTCFGHKLKHVMQSVVWRNLVIAYHILYNVCYITGVHTFRLWKMTSKRLIHLLVPIGKFIYRFIDTFLLKHIRSIINTIICELKRIMQGFHFAAHRIKQEYARKPRYAIRFALLLPFIAIRRHRKALTTVFNFAAPVLAAFILVSTIGYWSSKTFALAVEYEGETLGYITDESVYDVAANMASERVNNTDNSFKVERVPKLTIAVVSKSDILDESAVCDKIIRSSSDSIAEVSGLYVDGKFEGAVQSRSELESLLQSLVDSYRDGSQDERVEFVQKVQVVDGLYPISSVASIKDMRKHLTSKTMVDKYYEIVKGDSPLLIAAKTEMSLKQLRALNTDFDSHIFPGVKVLIQRAQPFLRVQVIRTVQYTETIGFSTKKVKDNKQYIGYSHIRTKGQQGEQLVTAEVTLLYGIEQSRNILSTTVTKNPVDKVIIVGAKKVNPSVSAAGDGIVTGKFTWPVPSCRMISSDYGYRWGGFHTGIDISGNGVYGKSIIAADGGRVVEVNTRGWGGGYGSYVIIDHGGGYRTVYAHCSSVLVRSGQKVSQGQLIAKIGSTGDSTGPHLHFEIRVNGRSTNPKPYLK